MALGVAAIGLLVPASTRSILKEALEAILEAVAAGVFEVILTVAVATAWRPRGEGGRVSTDLATWELASRANGVAADGSSA